jgi:hypothetical protein
MITRNAPVAYPALPPVRGANGPNARLIPLEMQKIFFSKMRE